MRKFFVFSLLLFCKLMSSETFPIDIISYEDFKNEDSIAMETLRKALFEKGIVGVRGVPGYRVKVANYLNAFRAFCSLPEECKERCSPDYAAGDIFLGYEKGRERFKRADGTVVYDDLKVSFYAYSPNVSENKWPEEVDLQIPFQEMSALMSHMGLEMLKKVGLCKYWDEKKLQETPRCGRLLHYRKSTESNEVNPFWCGEHFDHSFLTVLLPAVYYVDGVRVEEPSEAGLFVRATNTATFKKVVANDPDVIFFQVGEFGQLTSNDEIMATKHRVHKAEGNVERFTMALFFDAPHHTPIYSTSKLTEDPRYGGEAGDPCTYWEWSEATHKRDVKED